MRPIFERLELQVDWHEDVRTVVGFNNYIEIRLAIGSKVAKKNGVAMELDVPASILKGSTYVPLRFLAESMGAEVGWDAKTQTVTIDNNIEASGPVEDKNIYTTEYLEELVRNTKPKKDLEVFRKKPNSRRNGLKKIEAKYFDMYYPDDEQGKEVAGFLQPHMDRVYMMLTDLYDLQAQVEVHIIHEKDALNLKEGDIRAKENVTFVWIEPDNDDGGNNLSEFVHEINHNFFDQVNGGSTNKMWINEANAKLIPSLYIRHGYRGDVAMHSFYSLARDGWNIKNRIEKRGSYMTFGEISKHIEKPGSWGRETGDKALAQDMGLYFWSYLYNDTDLDTFKRYLRNLGTGDVVEKMEELLGKDQDAITKELVESLHL